MPAGAVQEGGEEAKEQEEQWRRIRSGRNGQERIRSGRNGPRGEAPAGELLRVWAAGDSSHGYQAVHEAGMRARSYYANLCTTPLSSLAQEEVRQLQPSRYMRATVCVGKGKTSLE
jgi:hypothetical protein